jgi:hypothetical protein
MRKFFVNGKPTNAFKRRSSFYSLTILPDGSAGYQPNPSLMDNALRKMREDSLRRTDSSVPAKIARLQF